MHHVILFTVEEFITTMNYLKVLITLRMCLLIAKEASNFTGE